MTGGGTAHGHRASIAARLAAKITAGAGDFARKLHSHRPMIPVMLQWSERFETGHPRVDAEHREFFVHLNEIGDAIERGASREAISRLIVVLLDYAHRHFQHEEEAMACANCPMHGANCSAHRKFIERVTVWLAAINSGVTPKSLLRDVHAEACRWIEHHITTIDVGLRVTPGATITPRAA